MTTLFIGLGRMGRPMAGHIAQRFSTAVHDVVAEAVDAVAAETGATPIRDLAAADLVGVETVVLMLPTSAHVEEILDHGGLLDRLEHGTLVIDMGSSIPASTLRLATAARERGVDYVDAPVSGGVAKAASGDLTMLVGGETGAIERAMSHLEAVGGDIVVVGSSGTGHAAKAINNLVSATNIAVATEAVLRAKAAGIAPERMVDVLNASTGMSQASRVKLVQHILPGTYASRFAYDLMLKDMGIAMAIEVPEAASPLAREAYRVLSEGRAALGEQPDHTEIARVYEHLAGTSIQESA